MTNKKKELTQRDLAIQIWKKRKVESATFDFVCGGDSMGDTELRFDINGKVIKTKKYKEDMSVLETYLENTIYTQVEFYDTSDGHYQGESGHVTITLNTDDKRQPHFEFEKSSQSEWYEEYGEITDIEIEPKEADILEKCVQSIEAGDSDSPLVTYSKDVILDDSEDNVIKSITDRLVTDGEEFNFKDAEGESMDYWKVVCSMSNSIKKMDDKSAKLEFEVSRTFCVWKDEENLFSTDIQD